MRLKNDCIWTKNEDIRRNETFPYVLSKFWLHSRLSASTLDFIQLQFLSIGHNFSRTFILLFLAWMHVYCVWSSYKPHMQYYTNQQVCIPVGCVLTMAVAISWVVEGHARRPFQKAKPEGHTPGRHPLGRQPSGTHTPGQTPPLYHNPPSWKNYIWLIELDKIKSTSAQYTMKSKFRSNIRKYLLSSNIFIFDPYAITKLPMQYT